MWGCVLLGNCDSQTNEILDTLGCHTVECSIYSGSDPGRDRFIELVSASNGAVVALGRTLTILPSRIRMISNADYTIRRR